MQSHPKALPAEKWIHSPSPGRLRAESLKQYNCRHYKKEKKNIFLVFIVNYSHKTY